MEKGYLAPSKHLDNKVSDENRECLHFIPVGSVDKLEDNKPAYIVEYQRNNDFAVQLDLYQMWKEWVEGRTPDANGTLRGFAMYLSAAGIGLIPAIVPLRLKIGRAHV